jgi:hypothetical protein
VNISRGSGDGVKTASELDDREVGVLVPVGSRILTFHFVQTVFEVHASFCPMGTGGALLLG